MDEVQKWDGGEGAPVDPQTIVQVWFRYKNTRARKPMTADSYSWKHTGGSGDIVEYQIIPAPSPPSR